MGYNFMQNRKWICSKWRSWGVIAHVELRGTLQNWYIEQVGVLSLLVSKLRVVAKNSSKIVIMSKNKFLGFFFWKKTVDLQEFKIFSKKVMEKWDG